MILKKEYVMTYYSGDYIILPGKPRIGVTPQGQTIKHPNGGLLFNGKSVYRSFYLWTKDTKCYREIIKHTEIEEGCEVFPFFITRL